MYMQCTVYAVTSVQCTEVAIYDRILHSPTARADHYGYPITLLNLPEPDVQVERASLEVDRVHIQLHLSD